MVSSLYWLVNVLCLVNKVQLVVVGLCFVNILLMLIRCVMLLLILNGFMLMPEMNNV
jgi:hypothetical protein